MTNHPNRKGKYELIFVGGVPNRYRRFHISYESARTTALKVLASLADRAAHPAIVYGPDFGDDGFTIA